MFNESHESIATQQVLAEIIYNTVQAPVNQLAYYLIFLSSKQEKEK